MTVPEPGETVGDIVGSPGDQVDLAKALDEISLEQALVDVEIANARAIDLTSRLLSARLDLVAAQKEITDLREHIDTLTAQIEAITRSRAYVWAHRLSRLRNAAR